MTVELHDHEVAALNAARTVLENVERRATKHEPGLSAGDAMSRGRLAEAAKTAEHDVFGVLNIYTSHGFGSLTYPQVHNRPEPVEVTADND